MVLDHHQYLIHSCVMDSLNRGLMSYDFGIRNSVGHLIDPEPQCLFLKAVNNR